MLISFVVSANSNNDTLHGGYKLNISTTMSVLPSTTIPVAKDCVLEMKKSKISEIVELFNNDRVHVVDIHVLFSNSSHDKELSDFHVKLLNPIGREILYSLEEFSFFTWTLNVGIRNFKLHVNKSQNDCIERQKNVTYFAFENMQKMVRRVNLATNDEVWYSFKETSSGEIRQFCCQITKHNFLKCNYECSKGNSFLYASSGLWSIISFMMGLLLWYGFTWLLFVSLSRTEFDLKYPKYYKLEESRMSPFSILFKIAWEEYGGRASFIRSCVLVVFFLYFNYLRFGRIKMSDRFTLVILIWGLWVSISSLFKPKITKSYILRKMHQSRNGNIFRVDLELLNRLWFESRLEVLQFGTDLPLFDITELLTAPFNSEIAGDVLCMHDYLNRYVREHIRNRIFKMLALCLGSVVEILLNLFLFLCLMFPISLLAVTLFSVLYAPGLLYMDMSLKYSSFDFCYGLLALISISDVTVSVLVLVNTLFTMVSVIQSFLLGLFLNLIYFIPYFAFLSVLTFYCRNYWKTMEEKYVVLTRLIYEKCREIRRVNNGCIPNRYPKREEKVLPVVSKELYNKVRGKLLPYHTNLFYFTLKMFWAFAFSFGIFKLIEMLNEFNVTGVVQVITTASLGVMPHIFNMVGLKTSEERKKAREENLKLNVKYLVEYLLRAHPELARTVLIIQQNNDATTEHPSDDDDDLEDTDQMLMINVNGTTADENVQDSENVQVSESDMNATDNDDAEGSELTKLLIIPENNDTTADENVHDSEKTEGFLQTMMMTSR